MVVWHIEVYSICGMIYREEPVNVYYKIGEHNTERTAELPNATTGAKGMKRA